MPAEADRQLIAEALANYAGCAIEEILSLHEQAMAPTEGAIAVQPCEAAAAIATIERRMRMAPLEAAVKSHYLERLVPLLAAPSDMTTVEATAWQTVARRLMPAVVTLDQPEVVLPAMPEPQVAAWHAVLDLDENLTAPWTLIGGQMVALWCAEAGFDVVRPTEDADIVLDVWLQRGALQQAGRLLNDRGFLERSTTDGYGYRYERDAACVDLMVPDHIERQNTQPTTTTGRKGLPAAGGNQALIRAQRVQVNVGARAGYVRRPNLLGALVAKAAAAVTDTRDSDRHREDLVVLAQIAVNRSEYRSMRKATGKHDRSRLRKALESLPAEHQAWRRIPEPDLVMDALQRLAQDQDEQAD